MSGTDSYYGRPVIKEPVWQPEIPCYFFTGGIAGASSVLSLVARDLGQRAAGASGRSTSAPRPTSSARRS